MTLRSWTFASLLLCLPCIGCPSDEGEDTDGVAETESGTATETESGTATETASDTGTETGAACGVAAMVCCAELEPCETTEDCCDPATYTCTLEGPTNKCIDRAKMCANCLASCPAAPDVCQASCAVWCDPLP